MATTDLVTSYGALILADQGLNITANKVQTLVKAAQIDNVPPIRASVIANALKAKTLRTCC
jgi:large subunit ribosomal protein LP1